jgi:Mn-dependent DtxR family transcriptional regulator
MADTYKAGALKNRCIGMGAMQDVKRQTSYILPRLREARRLPCSDLTSSVEDYLEVIYELMKERGYARSVDISEYLGVKSPSVTSMLQRLHGMGLVVYERYRGITLTERGKRLARSVEQRHLVITRFLRILGVSESIANSDAEGIEHHVHEATIERINKFVDFVEKNKAWFDVFDRPAKRGRP